jgi:hypothetical protein
MAIPTLDATHRVIISALGCAARSRLLIGVAALTLGCYEAPTPAEPPPYIIAAPQLQLPDTGTADAASLLSLTVVVDTAMPAEKRTITLFTTAGAFAASNNQSTTLTPDAAGAARSLLRAPTDSTAVIVTATVNGVSVSRTVTYRRAMPDVVDVVPDQLVLDVVSTNELGLTAYLRRTVGKPSPNFRVSFTAFEPGPAGKSIGAFLPPTAVSDDKGLATTKFVLADTSKRGPIVIRASVGQTNVADETAISVVGPPPPDTTKKSTP